MSDINFSLNIQATKDRFSQNFNVSAQTAVMNSAGMLAVTLNLGTTTQAVSTASANALGYALARSLSTATASTATISFGRISGTTLFETVQLRPGEASWFRLAPGNYAARAAVEGTPLFLQILED